MKKIIRFTADWCGPCKSMAANLGQTDTSGVSIEVIDIDKNTDIAMEYGIRNIPTLVMVDESNNVIKRKTGVMTPTQIKEWINGDD